MVVMAAMTEHKKTLESRDKMIDERGWMQQCRWKMKHFDNMNCLMKVVLGRNDSTTL